ncbi:DUF1798 family protein [Lentibacillus amyloliquefaciens]|uniref:DUF1798 domain-containing protein n=1 Tax=Lentibacillus amyloliquefaciens TaxID=1472767 RepID=A0A0U4EBJ1_9BACI|nr:DUF1798 family protein [Lentibacillus amyloliquefaciens]ALX47929.1 hypothetical protein AOX59_04500 [Lentibacillus amyloliquefaciens]
MNLEEQTIQLKEELERLKNIYEENNPPESKKDKDFFEMMKVQTAPIYDLLAEWEENTLKIVKERRVNVHPQQVTSTRENMELLLLNSYYVDVKRRRYMELDHSIHFIFDQLLSELRAD